MNQLIRLRETVQAGARHTKVEAVATPVESGVFLWLALMAQW